MHTMTVHDDPGSNPTQFIYHPDLSGDVLVNVAAGDVRTVPGQPGIVQVAVPGRNLQSFILHIAREQLIAELHNMNAGELAALFLRAR